jgi:hypothetical protein
MNKLTITGLLICAELVIGALLGRAYISQHSFIAPQQSLGQFFATVILIYCSTVFSLGAFNLKLTKKSKTKIIIRCITTSLVLATILALPILIMPYRIVSNLEFWDLSPFVVILLGLVIGFNFQLLRTKSAITNATQQKL